MARHPGLGPGSVTSTPKVRFRLKLRIFLVNPDFDGDLTYTATIWGWPGEIWNRLSVTNLIWVVVALTILNRILLTVYILEKPVSLALTKVTVSFVRSASKPVPVTVITS